MDRLLETNTPVHLINPKTKINSCIMTAKDVYALRFEMWKLYQKYYTIDQQAFFDRFQQNDCYAIYWDGDTMVGFTAIRMRYMVVGLKKIMTFYLGQSVLRTAYRGKSLITKTCACLFLKHYLRKPFMPIYVWCDALTYKPYLLFTNAFKEYYPSPKAKENEVISQLIKEIGTAYYPDSFEEATGTVSKTANFIVDADARISDKDLEHPAIRFFVEKNPRHNSGHGLLTIAPVSFKNMIALLRRLCWKQLKHSLSRFIDSKE